MGDDEPLEVFRSAHCDYCPGGTTAFLYPTQSDVGLNYQYLFPGTKLDPDKIPNISLQGFTAINTPRTRARGTTSCSCGPTTSRKSSATMHSRRA